MSHPYDASVRATLTCSFAKESLSWRQHPSYQHGHVRSMPDDDAEAIQHVLLSPYQTTPHIRDIQAHVWHYVLLYNIPYTSVPQIRTKGVNRATVVRNYILGGESHHLSHLQEQQLSPHLQRAIRKERGTTQECFTLELFDFFPRRSR